MLKEIIQSILQLFRWSDKQKARILSSYAKRIAERYYNKLFETPWGKRLIAQGKTVKYAEEFLLYLISAYADERLPERTVFQMFFRDVFLDAFPEFAKRMLNGESREEAGKKVFTTELCRKIESEQSIAPVDYVAKLLRGLTNFLDNKEKEKE